jgi:hypothetical protein
MHTPLHPAPGRAGRHQAFDPVPGKRALLPLWHRFGDAAGGYFVDHVMFNATPHADESVFERMPKADDCRASHRGIPMSPAHTDVEDVAWRWACGRQYASGGDCADARAHLTAHAVHTAPNAPQLGTAAGVPTSVSRHGHAGRGCPFLRAAAAAAAASP